MKNYLLTTLKNKNLEEFKDAKFFERCINNDLFIKYLEKYDVNYEDNRGLILNN